MSNPKSALERETLAYHELPRPGKLEVVSSKPLLTQHDLSLAYTPGVAIPCLKIQDDPAGAYRWTNRGNLVAVITNGTAVLGLGNIGALAGKPVMEGKAVLFKKFAGIDVFDIEVDEEDIDAFVDTVRRIAPTFGGINLEDIKAPECFEIEETLERELDIPVFHDDQHGTAVVVLAAVINALKWTERDPASMRVVVAGAGAAGVACIKILDNFGIGEIVACDRKGAIWAGREDFSANPAKRWLSENTNAGGRRGTLHEVLAGADMLLGLSGPGLVTREDLETMNAKPLIFALSNPTPEIMPEEAAGIAGVMATGRSDYPNQINNVLAFPGIFRGALDCRARNVNEEMKLAAAHAIAECVAPEELSAEYIVPSVFHRGIAKRVAKAVARAGRETGVARRTPKATYLG